MKWIFVLAFAAPVLSIAQRQGVKGQLYWAPDQSSADFKHSVEYRDKPVEVIVFEMTDGSGVVYEDGQIKKVLTLFVARSFCKWDGSFKIKLPPGSYSVFVYRNGSYFGNIRDAQGNLSPAVVTPKRYSWVTITLPQDH